MMIASLADLPERFNGAADLLSRNLNAGRATKTAIIDCAGAMTYGELHDQVRSFGGMLLSMGLQREQRIILCLHDTRAFQVAFLGALWVGIVPIPVNTLLTQSDYSWLLNDSRARAVFKTPEDERWNDIVPSNVFLRDLEFNCVFRGDPVEAADTHRDEPAFWLYSSGSTGRPKGVIHSHGTLRLTAELYAGGIVGYRASDVVLSVAKMFFAYGLGNSLTFPLWAGATVVLNADRPKAEIISDLLRKYEITVLNGVPTFFSALVAAMEGQEASFSSLRLVTSAGESLPPQLGFTFKERFGLDILDGLGSTEMLHIFLSQTPGDVRYGFTGKPVPGYSCSIVDDDGSPTPAGEIGNLIVSGPTAALGYWNNRPRTLNTFKGDWTHTGDKYSQTHDGWYRYHGRVDDMLKVGGIFVSPLEVEECLLRHPAVREVAVVGVEDDLGLLKPSAFVALKPGWFASVDLADTLKAHAKMNLAPYKFPHHVTFLEDLPKTATGKIQRFRLRIL